MPGSASRGGTARLPEAGLPAGASGDAGTGAPGRRGGPGQDHRGGHDPQGVHAPRPRPPRAGPGAGQPHHPVAGRAGHQVRPGLRDRRPTRRLGRAPVPHLLPGHRQDRPEPEPPPRQSLRPGHRGRGPSAAKPPDPGLEVRGRGEQQVPAASHRHPGAERSPGALQPGQPPSAGDPGDLPELPPPLHGPGGQAAPQEHRRAVPAPEQGDDPHHPGQDQHPVPPAHGQHHPASSSPRPSGSSTTRSPRSCATASGIRTAPSS